MLANVDQLKSRYQSEMQGTRDEELEACLVAAQGWVSANSGQEWELGSAVTTRLDGDRAGRGTLYLPHKMVQYPTDFTLTEDGLSLTAATAQGYSATATVLIADAGTLFRPRLIKDSGWSCGRQNVVAAYKFGWSAATVPGWVVSLILQVAWRLFSSPAWTGKAAVSVAGNAVTFNVELDDMGRASLARLAA